MTDGTGRPAEAPTLDRICVFAGSRSGADDRYASAARELGSLLAREGLEVVFGGGRWGLMGELAGATLEAGGSVVGVIPEPLLRKEGRREDLTRLEVVDSMHERKARMADLADGFVSLPGGLGTLEETCEMLTWAQLGFHAKPCGLLNVAGYFDALIAFLDRSVEQGFVDRDDRDLLHVATTPEALIGRFRAIRPRGREKMLEREEL